MTPSITFGNASPCRPPYTGNNMLCAREDGNQHKQFASAPMVAQIVCSHKQKPQVAVTA